MTRKRELIEQAISALGEHFTPKEVIWEIAFRNARHAASAYKPKKSRSALPVRSQAWKRLSLEQQQQFITEDDLRRRLEDACATVMHRANLISIFVKVLIPIPLATELVDTLILKHEEPDPDEEDP